MMIASDRSVLSQTFRADWSPEGAGPPALPPHIPVRGSGSRRKRHACNPPIGKPAGARPCPHGTAGGREVAFDKTASPLVTEDTELPR